MLKSEGLDLETTRAILKKMNRNCFVMFIRFTNHAYSQENPPPNFKTIIKAIATVEATRGHDKKLNTVLKELQGLDLSDAFVKGLLGYVPPSNSLLVAQLVDLIKEDCDSLRPEYLASYCLGKIEAEGNSFVSAPILKAYQTMSDDQKATFFLILAKRYHSKECSHKAEILNLLKLCISNTINLEFAKRFNDTAQLNAAFSLAPTLVRYFSKIVGETIARQEDPDFWKESVEMMYACYCQACNLGEQGYYNFYKAMRDVLEVKPPEELGELWAPLIHALYPDSRIKPPSQHKNWIKELLPYMPEALAYATILTSKINIRFAFEDADIDDELNRYFNCLIDSEKGQQILIDMLKQEIDENWEEDWEEDFLGNTHD